MKGDTKKPEYLALFPYGKIPAFKGSDGFKLIEGKAIARYSTFSFPPPIARSSTPSCLHSARLADNPHRVPRSTASRWSFAYASGASRLPSIFAFPFK